MRCSSQMNNLPYFTAIPNSDLIYGMQHVSTLSKNRSSGVVKANIRITSYKKDNTKCDSDLNLKVFFVRCDTQKNKVIQLT